RAQAGGHTEDERQQELGAQVSAEDARNVVLQEQRRLAVLRRKKREATHSKARAVHEQVQRDHQRQHEVDDHAAEFGKGADQVLEHARAALLNGRKRLCFEGVDVGLDAVLAKRALEIRRTGLEIGGVL